MDLKIFNMSINSAVTMETALVYAYFASWLISGIKILIKH